MIEIQGDAGGRRFVAPLAAAGPSTSCDMALPAGEQVVATALVETVGSVQGVQVTVKAPVPLVIDIAKLQSFLFYSTQPTTVTVGSQEFPITPQAPLMWFRNWLPMVPCPINESASPLGITAVADVEAQLTILLVH